MPKLILAVAALLVGRGTTNTRGAASNPGWLGRHNSRRRHAARGLHEPYVDLGPLDLTRRH